MWGRGQQVVKRHADAFLPVQVKVVAELVKVEHSTARIRDARVQQTFPVVAAKRARRHLSCVAVH